MTRKNLLIVDDEEEMRHMLSVLLRKEGYKPEVAQDGVEALEKIEKTLFDIILCDIKMPRMDGLKFLGEVKKRHVESIIIMMSAYGSVDTAIEAMKQGAADYINKPIKADEIILTLRKNEERDRLKKENVLLRKAVKKEYQFDNIIAKSQNMHSIFDTIEKIAEYKSTVLVSGESGTGKELVARAIHYNSLRSEGPFIAVNCGAIPENLLESELFGHLKGSFTDAVRNKKGLFEEADDGSLFLDEVGELPKFLQVKLLRALQESEVRRVGDTKSVKVDVRVIAATAKELAKEVQEGTFRDDLYYRLNVLPIQLPPLRDRREDIPLLTQHFVQKYNLSLKLMVEGFSNEAMNLMVDYAWPGNVRELENTIERAMVLVDGNWIDEESLPDRIRYTKSVERIVLKDDEYSIKKSTRIMEEELIRKALRKTRGNRTHAAKLLEISHRTLLYKIEEYGVNL